MEKTKEKQTVKNHLIAMRNVALFNFPVELKGFSCYYVGRTKSESVREIEGKGPQITTLGMYGEGMF